MPITETVHFVAKLQKRNRIQIPVEVRSRFKLEAGELLNVKLNPVKGLVGEQFVARLLPGGRMTIPWEVAWVLNLDKPGYMLRVQLIPPAKR